MSILVGLLVFVIVAILLIWLVNQLPDKIEGGPPIPLRTIALIIVVLFLVVWLLGGLPANVPHPINWHS